MAAASRARTHVVDPHQVRTGQDGRSDGSQRGILPASNRRIHSLIERRQGSAQKCLTGNTSKQRLSQAAQFFKTRQQRVILFERIPKPNPGSRTIRSRSIPAFQCLLATAAATPPDQGHDLLSVQGGQRCHSSGRPRVCISTTPQPAAAQTWAIASSHKKPLTSLTISAPASSAAAAVCGLVGIDGENGIRPMAQNAFQHRNHPVDLLLKRHWLRAFPAGWIRRRYRRYPPRPRTSPERVRSPCAG